MKIKQAKEILKKLKLRLNGFTVKLSDTEVDNAINVTLDYIDTIICGNVEDLPSDVFIYQTDDGVEFDHNSPEESTQQPYKKKVYGENTVDGGGIENILNDYFDYLEKNKINLPKESTVIKEKYTHDYKPPFRVGRNLNRAVLDSNGYEVVTFPNDDGQAQRYCDFLNDNQNKRESFDEPSVNFKDSYLSGGDIENLPKDMDKSNLQGQNTVRGELDWELSERENTVSGELDSETVERFNTLKKRIMLDNDIKDFLHPKNWLNKKNKTIDLSHRNPTVTNESKKFFEGLKKDGWTVDNGKPKKEKKIDLLIEYFEGKRNSHSLGFSSGYIIEHLKMSKKEIKKLMK